MNDPLEEPLAQVAWEAAWKASDGDPPEMDSPLSGGVGG